MQVTLKEGCYMLLRENEIFGTIPTLYSTKEAEGIVVAPMQGEALEPAQRPGIITGPYGAE